MKDEEEKKEAEEEIKTNDNEDQAEEMPQLLSDEEEKVENPAESPSVEESPLIEPPKFPKDVYDTYVEHCLFYSLSLIPIEELPIQPSKLLSDYMKLNYQEEFGRVNLKYSNYKIGKLLKKFDGETHEYCRIKG